MNNNEFLEWIKNSKKNRISEAHIINGVNKGSCKLVEGLCSEFEIMSNFKKLILPFHKKAQTLDYSEVYNLIDKMENNDFKEETADLIKILLRIGFFGKFVSGDDELIVKYPHRYPLMRVRKTNEYYLSIFSFADDYEINVSDTDKLVISPMFWDYLDTKVKSDREHLIYASKPEENGIRYN